MDELDTVLSTDSVIYPEQFLAEVIEAAAADTPELDEIVARAAQVDAAAAEVLGTALRGCSDPARVLADLTELGPQAAYARHWELVDLRSRGDGGAPAQEQQPVDESVWYAYLAENGPAWDGTDESWPAFVEWFRYHADERGVGEYAQQLCDYLSSVDDKVEALAGYGVTIVRYESVDAQHDVTIEAPVEVAAVPQSRPPLTAAGSPVTEAATTDPVQAADALVEEPVGEPAVTELRWVTEKQIDSLGELEEALGPWETWLSDELDGRMPGWTELPAETLVDRLDDMIPLLVLPPADALDDVATDMTEKIQQLAESDPEVMELLSEMDHEELAELIDEALAIQN